MTETYRWTVTFRKGDQMTVEVYDAYTLGGVYARLKQDYRGDALANLHSIVRLDD